MGKRARITLDPGSSPGEEPEEEVAAAAAPAAGAAENTAPEAGAAEATTQGTTGVPAAESHVRKMMTVGNVVRIVVAGAAVAALVILWRNRKP